MATVRNLETASIVLLVGMLSLPLGAKIIPGGPFISLFGDVIPAASGMVAIWCSLPYVTFPLTRIKASAMAHMVLAAAMIGLVALNVVTFYFNPYARGATFGL